MTASRSGMPNWSLTPLNSFNHGLLNHADCYIFNGASFDFFVDSFFSQEIFKARSNMIFFHFKPFSRFNRSLAKSRSGFGVFWLFLIKPCKSTIELPFTTDAQCAINWLRRSGSSVQRPGAYPWHQGSRESCLVPGFRQLRAFCKSASD